MQTSSRTIDHLKEGNHMFAAGALAHSMGLGPGSYGCHFGMRSTLEADKAAFAAGWLAANAHRAGSN